MHDLDYCAAHRSLAGATATRRARQVQAVDKQGVLPGMQVDDQNTRKRSTYPVPGPHPNSPLPTINNVIRDLDARQRLLLAYLEEHIGELEPGQVVAILGLHGQNAARLGRLLRDKRALSGESADSIAEAIGKVLDELATAVQAEL